MVLGEALGQEGSGGGERDPARPGDEVRDEFVRADEVARHDHRLLHVGMRAQDAFHVAELDAVPANLDLRVAASEKIEAAVASPARQIARVVHAPARRAGKRIRHEAVRRQRRPPEITRGEARARDVQTAGDADGHRLEPRVEQAHRGVVDRRADRRMRTPRRRRTIEAQARHDVRFGGPVMIPERARFAPLEEPPHLVGHDELFAGRGNLGQRAGLRAAPQENPGQLAEHHHGHDRFFDPLPNQQLDERFRIPAHVLGHEREAAPRPERGEDLVEAGVEAERGELQRPAAGTHRAQMPPDEIGERAMRQHDALRLAGRARRVQHVGRRLAVNRPARVVPRSRRSPLVTCIEIQPLHAGGNPLAGRSPGDDRAYAGVGRHGPEPQIGQRRIERHVGGARLENGDDRRDHLERAIQADADDFPWRHAGVAKPSGQLVRALVDLAIAPAPIAVRRRQRLRRPLGLRLEQIDDGVPRQRVRRRVGGVVEAAEHERFLPRREERQPARRLVGVRRDLRAQALVVLEDRRRRLRIEEIRAVLERGLQIGAAPLERQRQVEFRRAARHRNRRHLEPGEREPVVPIFHVHEEVLEHRRSTRDRARAPPARRPVRRDNPGARRPRGTCAGRARGSRGTTARRRSASAGRAY